MFRKTLSLVLLGILLIGTITVVYGTFFDKGFGTSVASVLGSGDEDHDHKRGHGNGRGGEDEDDDD
jgi:hypothetical protein